MRSHAILSPLEKKSRYSAYIYGELKIHGNKFRIKFQCISETVIRVKGISLRRGTCVGIDCGKAIDILQLRGKVEESNWDTTIVKLHNPLLLHSIQSLRETKSTP